jgi:hypothetical protein
MILKILFGAASEQKNSLLVLSEGLFPICDTLSVSTTGMNWLK